MRISTINASVKSYLFLGRWHFGPLIFALFMIVAIQMLLLKKLLRLLLLLLRWLLLLLLMLLMMMMPIRGMSRGCHGRCRRS